MPVQRNWTPRDPREAFFPVEERPAFWLDTQNKHHYIPGQKVLVDVERQTHLGVVSAGYHLITNREAVEKADIIIRGVFGTRTLDDFQCYNIMMPSTRSFCRMDFILPTSGYSAFGDHSGYTPFVRISNSYNRMLVLRYEIGFCRWICLNGCIFGAKSYTATFVHSLQKRHKTVQAAIEEARRALGTIDGIWAVIERKINTLSKIPVPFELALPVFCQVFDVPNVGSEEVSFRVADKYAERGERFLKQAQSYYEELGPTAYALFNALTDFASFPDGEESRSSTLVHGYQRRVGTWADDVVASYSPNVFSFDRTIKEEARESAKELRKLISREKVLILK